tara:strand:+ start:365 stop:1120 length:756 start_codon:yes stop_codon:yes gene_type:complete
MAFGGSSTSFTLPHTHNQTLVNDGGTLSTTLTDMGAVTLFSLISGATDPQTAINTAAIATNVTNISTNAANIATNTAAIAALPTAAWSRIVNQTQTGGSANFNVTGLTSTSKYMMFTFAGQFGGNDQLRMRLGTGGSIDTGTSYKWACGANGTYSTSPGDTSITVNSANFEVGRNFFLSGFMQWNAAEDGSGTASSRIGNIQTTGAQGGTYLKFNTGFEYLESATPITDVRFYANGGNDLNGTLNMYQSQD